MLFTCFPVTIGIKGMRWGVRRFQNEDGTLTDAGRRRQGIKTSKQQRKLKEYVKDIHGNKVKNPHYDKKGVNEVRRRLSLSGKFLLGSFALAGAAFTAGFHAEKTPDLLEALHSISVGRTFLQASSIMEAAAIGGLISTSG